MKYFLKLLVAISVFVSGSVLAETKVGVLDIELLDLTLKVSDPQMNADIEARDQQNVALTESLLREGFDAHEQYTLVEIDSAAQARADKSVGFLFDRPDSAAELGREFGADYVVVGRYHKPTYLFSYIMLRIVDVHSGRMVEELKTEVKGRPQETIPRNIRNVMIEIDALLAKHEATRPDPVE